jgi:AraC family transcriptional regulator, regulatory protein of adaptative response / methylated-DNA-[protein]-cysteine methyltransferase
MLKTIAMGEKKTRLNVEDCWEAVQRRDSSFDGQFYYGVLTTGVFCRPGCRGRTPNRENVRFYESPVDAERDGLRACLRCKPLAMAGLDRTKERMEQLCFYISANADQPLTLQDLSRAAGLSPFHLQRSFKAVVGVTPKQYLDDVRMRAFKSKLRAESQNDSVTGAIFDSGFGSLSRVYEKTDGQLGMTPMEYRHGGRGVSITYGVGETGLGLVMIGATDRGLCFLQFGDSAEALRKQLEAEYPEAHLTTMADPAPPLFAEWMASLNRYLAGQETDLRLPLHIRATAFQVKVWKYLQSIPSGSVESYEEVAKGIGQPRAARAVARACATNHVALVIPCHRVIRGTGELGGYKWGLERKRVLIDGERRVKAAGES